MQLAWANEANLCDDQRVITVSVDGQRRTMKPGETLVLKPGQGICLPPRLYHRFWAEKAFVLGWEISMVMMTNTITIFLSREDVFRQ